MDGGEGKGVAAAAAGGAAEGEGVPFDRAQVGVVSEQGGDLAGNVHLYRRCALRGSGRAVG